LAVWLLSPALAAAVETNVSDCPEAARRPLSLDTESVAVLRTGDGPAVAILATQVSATGIAYRWRYRASRKSAVESGTGWFQGDPARKASSIGAEQVFLVAGPFLIELNLDAVSPRSLSYCPNRAILDYVSHSQFELVP